MANKCTSTFNLYLCGYAMVISVMVCCCSMAFGPCGGRGGLGGRGGRGGSRGAAQLAPMINMALTMADALQIFFIHKSFNDVSFAGPAQMAWRTWCRKFSSPGPEVSGYP